MKRRGYMLMECLVYIGLVTVVLGAGYAARRYRRRHRRQPKHECGVNLFRVHVGPVLRAVRARPDVTIVEARPRYYPRWCGWLVRLPGVREVATWNLMLILRRVG